MNCTKSVLTVKKSIFTCPQRNSQATSFGTHAYLSSHSQFNGVVNCGNC